MNVFNFIVVWIVKNEREINRKNSCLNRENRRNEMDLV